jgi:hypothetical protein
LEAFIIEKEKVSKYAFISAVGHEPTARVLSKILGCTVPLNRVPIQLESGDAIIVATLYDLSGRPFRPPEGKILSEDELGQLKIQFVFVRVTD